MCAWLLGRVAGSAFSQESVCGCRRLATSKIFSRKSMQHTARTGIGQSLALGVRLGRRRVQFFELIDHSSKSFRRAQNLYLLKTRSYFNYYLIEDKVCDGSKPCKGSSGAVNPDDWASS